jgi:cytidylate kinase
MHRPDGPVVAIDGPAGAGKSTVARAVARRLGLLYLDTGALYRAIGWKALEARIDPGDGECLADLCRRIDLRLERGPDGANHVWVDGVDVTGAIRTPEVSLAASRVSGQPCVRGRLLDLQREAGERGGVILDGRDIGTVVFPDAELKVFLDASPEVRARRRTEEMAARGEAADPERVLAEVRARDEADSGRALAPLKQAPDAVRLDTSGLTLDQVVERVCALVEAARGPA